MGFYQGVPIGLMGDLEAHPYHLVIFVSIWKNINDKVVLSVQ